jgi:hypothetical protein
LPLRVDFFLATVYQGSSLTPFNLSIDKTPTFTSSGLDPFGVGFGSAHVGGGGGWIPYLQCSDVIFPRNFYGIQRDRR